MSFLKKYKPHLVLALLLVFIISSWTVFPTLNRVTYSRNTYKADSLAENAALTIDVLTPRKTATTTTSTSAGAVQGASSTLQVVHVPTPSPMRAIYMTSWVAGTASIREKLLSIIDSTEINSVVIDIKDYTGKISFIPNDPELLASGVGEKRISDIDGLIDRLHKKGVYVIGRVAVFQDPFMVSKHPEIAVKRQSDGGVWKDRKGISWIDAGSQVQWDHTAKIARESYARGFDEINFDYVRYPSDGNMKDIAFPVSGNTAKHIAIKNFLSNMRDQLKPEGIVLSADLFGLTAVAADDLGIGQKLEDALLTMDYVYPMVYPSHFANGWNGFANPAIYPYEVIKTSMQGAIQKAYALGAPVSVPVVTSASSTIQTTPASKTISELSKQYAYKLRPWLQDFNLGATYDTAMVKKQIQGTYDAGLDSWLMWSPSNVYHADAFEKNP